MRPSEAKAPMATGAGAAGAAGGLAILVDEKRVNELLQQKSGIKALLRCDAVAPQRGLCFLGVRHRLL